MRVKMLDPDILGRLEGLDRDHLTALFDFMFGIGATDVNGADAQPHPDASTRAPQNAKTPGANRELS